MNEIDGDMSCVVRRILEDLFFNPEQHDFSRSGVNVEFHDGGHALIHADLRLVLADESALHAIYACKGSSGLKICLICTNVYNGTNPREVAAADRTRTAVYHTCAEVARFQHITPAIMAAIVRRLTGAAASLSATKLDEIQTDIGWKYVLHGLMLSESTRVRCCPSTRAAFDWAHVFFVNGVFNVAGGLLLHSLRRLKVDMSAVSGYIGLFRWPSGIGESVKPHEVFSKSRLASSLEKKTLRCSASEGLCVLPVLAAFGETLNSSHPDPEVRRHAHCFLLLALVIGQVLRSARGLMDRHEFLRRAQAFLPVFCALYGEAFATPKFHYMMHLGLYRLKFLPNCLVHERKHKGVKRYANPVFNTHIDWDKAILEEATCLHIEKLINAPPIQFSYEAGLDDARAPSRKMMRVLQSALGDFPKDAMRVSNTARVNKFEKVSIGDIVLVGTSEPPIIGKVGLHVAVSDAHHTEHVTLIDEFNVSSESRRFWKCTAAGRQSIVPTGSIDAAVVWGGGPIFTVLKPLNATRSKDI